MRFSQVLSFVAVAATAAVEAVSLPPGVPRNVLEFRDKHPYKNPKPGCRKIVRIRASEDDEDDVSAEFKKGVEEANNGGTLYLPEGETFVIGKVLDLTGLSDIHVRLDGEIKVGFMGIDICIWRLLMACSSRTMSSTGRRTRGTTPSSAPLCSVSICLSRKAFLLSADNMKGKWGGHDIKIYGEGVIEGQGQRWWNEFEAGTGSILVSPANPGNKYYRPILFYAENTTNLDVSGIHLKDSPCWNNFIVSSKNVRYTDVIATALSNNGSIIPKNTDFMNTMNTSSVSIERVWVNIDDDCFSPKPNSSDLYVNTMYCNGTHGQYSGARIKIWAGADIGTGYVNNVTFKYDQALIPPPTLDKSVSHKRRRNFWVARMDYGIILDSCYFNKSVEECNKYPSGMDITNIRFEELHRLHVGRLRQCRGPPLLLDGRLGRLRQHRHQGLQRQVAVRAASPSSSATGIGDDLGLPLRAL
ncbi:exopolygalacturonase [Verticillium alfalfae VaMs.102]|uniref:galacturonan 1,4-alpha-galacturonidase n=1 Tax=Verticillium alfalfae (strain VaMs.102 / ATCC MYA-4576 / FGSC 10136) TaxID=526221 RepID=C9SA85_VERA1|nr:exopolygalacturonase [Verticillium alfalfae VaMs.102]EEY16298.1 exopolygalacturonase [Verticillium alfalfae VaMs.102]